MAGRQADEIQVNFKILKLAIGNQGLDNEANQGRIDDDKEEEENRENAHQDDGSTKKAYAINSRSRKKNTEIRG